jgi:hypothetical protein
MSSLTAALEALLAEHDRIGSPVRHYLTKGRPEAEVRSRLQALGLDPADDLVAFYAWQDGIETDVWRRDSGAVGGLYLYPWYTSPGLAEAEERYRIKRLVSTEAYGKTLRRREDVPDVGYWAKSWFPLFIGDLTYAADSRGGPVSSVWRQASHPDGPTLPLYPAILDLIDDIAGRFRRGVYTWLKDAADFDSDEDLELDLDRQTVTRAAASPIAHHDSY